MMRKDIKVGKKSTLEST